jgi:dipeptidyl aminopeptidase/acylaminoacyl peptidase
MPKHPISKLLRITGVAGWQGGLSISPKGDYAAINWNKSGTWEIWLVSLDGKRKPKRLTAPPYSKSSPHFSPDGSKLGWMQDYNGDEKHDLHVYDFATGEVRNVMPDTDEALNDTFSWSPNSRQAVIVSNKGRHFAVHLLDLESSAQRRLTEHSYSDMSAQWSPDGANIAFTSSVTGQVTNVFVMPVSGGEPRAIADANGPIDASSQSWSPDGKHLAFVGHPDDNAQIGIYHLETNTVEWVTNEKWDHESPTFSKDGRQLAYTVNHDGSLSLVVVEVTTGRKRRFDVEDGYHVEPHFAPNGDIVTVFSSARRPPDLWKLTPKTGKWVQLTDSMPAGIKPNDFVSPSVVRWKAPDGLTISGLLYTPKGKPKKRPLLLYVHGGPSWQSYNAWYALVQIYVAEGWNVLCPNYRGSTGYGKKFQEANRYVMGHADTVDIVAGAKHLVRKGLADPAHIGITGASYGGYMTMTSLTRHPDVFSVGSAVVPFINWFTEFETEREDLRYWDLQNMGDPAVNPERFHEASPMFFLDRITAPIQLLAGAHDPRCPAGETQQAVDELARMGKIHEAIIFPDEGHGFLKMANRLKAYTSQIKFLKKHI